MKNYLLIFLYLVNTFSFAQIAPSPDALGTVTPGAQEDLFRGFITENIPIYTVQADNGYQVPIQLTYQTRGIRVSDIASSVGLGWNLAAGGAITRVMRDEPDEQSAFSNAPSGSHILISQYHERKGIDFEKDIFYYSNPAGGGTFISTRDAAFVSGSKSTDFYGLPYTDNEIEFSYIDNNTSNWKITDTQGIQYIYGESASAREITRSQQYEQGQNAKENADFTYISTWYLEKIIFPNLPANQNIQFTYLKSTKKLTTTTTTSTQEYDLIKERDLWYYERKDGGKYFRMLKRYHNGFNLSCCNTYDIPMIGIPGVGATSILGLYNYNKLEDDRCDLDTSVECQDDPKGPQFYQNLENREDYNISTFPIYKGSNSPTREKTYYSKVEITPSTLRRIQSFKSTVDFNHTARIDISALPRIDQINVKDHKGKTALTYALEQDYFDASGQHAGCTSNSNCKRLKLKSVSRNGFVLGRFQYMNELDASLELPSRESKKIDRFGYFKSDVTSPYERYTFNQYDPESPAHRALAAQISVGPTANSRKPHMDARANSLWKIIYPTGGVREFEYGSKSSGGIVISSVKLWNGASLVAHTSYSYAGAIAMRNDLHALSGGPSGLSVLLFSDSPYLTFDHMNLGGYSSAVAKNELLGTSTGYTFYKGKIIDSSEKSKWSLSISSGGWTKLEDIDSHSAPLMSPGYDPRHGLPFSVKTYDENNQLVSKNKYYYRYVSNDKQVTEHAFVLLNESGAKYNVGKSVLLLRPFLLDFTTTEIYEKDIRTGLKTAYTYHPVFQTLPREVESFRIGESGDRMINKSWNDTKTITYYPGDREVLRSKSLPETNVIPALITKNMIALPLVTENWIRKPTISGSFSTIYALSDVLYNTYQNVSGLYVPFKNYTSEFNQLKLSWNNTSITEIGTSLYNSSGRMISSIDRSGLATTYNYDVAGYLESESTSAGGMIRTTAYSHLPLIGVETITGPDSRTTTYEYDDRNRLHLVRDSEGNILNRYRYNYQSENDQLSAEIELSGQPLAGRNVTFKAADLTAYGGMDNTQTHWSISRGGNGSITIGEPTVVDELYSGEGSTAAVTFNEVGDYSVRLSLYNPEYDEPKVIYKNISINNQYWSPGAPTGITSACACSGAGDVVLDGPFLNDDGNNDCVPVVGVYALHVQHGSTSCGDISANLTYEWEYKSSTNANWISFGNNTSAALPGELYSSPKTVQIRYKVSDTCGVTKTSSEISVYINYCN